MASPSKNKPKTPAPKGNAKVPTSNTKGSSPGGINHWLLPGLLLAGILALTYFIYQPALNYGFTNWDDDAYVTENAIIGHPENFHQMLTTPVGGNYHPLTMYSLAYDYKAVEALPLEQKGGRFHAVNILLHLCNILLVFYFTYLFSKRRMWMSLACALFFAIHPMHVESVAWVAERKDVLYTFFFFLSLISYLLYVDRKKYIWLLVCLLAFVLSLASKPAAVILPLVLLCIDYFRSRKVNVAIIVEKIPFFILSIIGGLLTIKAQQASGAVAVKAVYPLIERVLFPFYALMMYWVKLFFPFNLAVVYPFPNIEGKPLTFEYYLAPIVVVVVTGAIIYFGKGKKIMLFGLLFFLINVVLILQFVNVGQAIISERYTYVAYLGLFMMLTWWLDDKDKGGSLRWVGLAAIALFAVVFAAKSAERVKIWSNDETLWTDEINQFPMQVPDAYNNLGYFYRHHAQPDKALSNYSIAIALHPVDPKPWGNRGNIFFDAHRFDSAIANYNRAIALNPHEWETLSNRGASKAQLGDLQGGLNDLTLSLSGDSANAAAWTNRALIYSLMSQHENAISDYRRALQRTPKADNLINAIAVEYQRAGKYTESIAEFNKAIDLAPNTGIYYLNRSYSWNGTGNKQNAIQDMQKARSMGVRVPDEYLKILAGA